MIVIKNGIKQKINNDAQLAAYKKAGWNLLEKPEEETDPEPRRRGRPRQEPEDNEE